MDVTAAVGVATSFEARAFRGVPQRSHRVVIGEGGGEFPRDFRHGLRDDQRRPETIRDGQANGSGSLPVPSSTQMSARLSRSVLLKVIFPSADGLGWIPSARTLSTSLVST